MQPIIVFGSLSGYYCISSFGHRHSDRLLDTAKYQISKTKVILTMICVIIIFYHLLNYLWKLFNMKEFSADKFVILLNEILCCSGDLSVKIYFLVKTGDKLQMLLTYQSTFNNPSQETNGCITAADVKYAKKLQFLNICIACCILATYVTIAYMFSEHLDLKHITRIVIDLIILYANMVTAFQINSEFILIYLLFHKLRTGLIKVLSVKSTNSRNAENVLTPISFVSRLTSTHVRQAYKQHHVFRNLQRLRHFHIIAMKNFKILNRYFSASLVNWCSFVSVILMVNSYIIVTSCLNSVEASATIVISAVARSTIYISSMSLLFFHVQCIVDVVSKICYIQLARALDNLRVLYTMLHQTQKTNFCAWTKHKSVHLCV